MLLESYDSAQNVQAEQSTGDKFSFPFSQELDIQHKEVFFFYNDSWNTYILKSKKDSLTDGIPLALQPTPPNPRASNNPPPVRLPPTGQQNQNQGNVLTILKNPTWSTKKYSVVEDLKWNKANISMFDMLQNFQQ